MRRFMLCFALVALAFVSADRAQATEWKVPNDDFQIRAIIPSTSNGDTISVVNISAAIQRPIYVNKSLLIRNTTGSPITLLSDTDSMAVDVATSGVVIDGGTGTFKVTGASGPPSVVDLQNATMRNCAIEDSGYAYASDGVVHIDYGGTLTDCSVTLTSTTSALAVQIETTSGAEVSNCTISSAKDGSAGDYDAIVVTSSGAEILNNTFSFTNASTVGEAIVVTGTSPVVDGNLITGAKYGLSLTANGASVTDNIMDLRANGWGIHTGSSGGHTMERNTIYLSSCSSGAAGLWFNNSPGTSTASNNLFYNVLYGIYYGAGSTDNLSHNLFWGACGDSSNRSLSASQISEKEPLFCGGEEGTESFTQRIDSHAAPGNNGWGELVGARDIECAWGTLARNTTVPKNKTVKVLRDVTVSAGKSLTVAHDVSFLIDDDDDSSGGSDATKNELIVNGTLTVTGKADSLVDFVSSLGSPGESDWRGIDLYGSDAAHIAYGNVRNAVYGVLMTDPDTASITNSQFSANGTFDILAAGAGTSCPF